MDEEEDEDEDEEDAEDKAGGGSCGFCIMLWDFAVVAATLIAGTFFSAAVFGATGFLFATARFAAGFDIAGIGAETGFS